MKQWVLLLWLLRVACPAQAVTLDELQQRLAQQPAMRAEFRQERHMRELSQPLRSSGELLLSPTSGLWWQQQQPFPLTLRLDNHRLVQEMPGEAAQSITAESNPQLFQLTHLLRAVFQADRLLLAQNFSLQFIDQGAGKWQLQLLPITAPLDKLFSTITLQGEHYLNHILLQDRQGDRTEITFSQQRLAPEVLTAGE